MILNIPHLVVIMLVVVAALIDVRSRRIPNYLTLSGWGIGLMYHVVTGGLDGLMFSSAGLVLGICLLLFFYLLGGVGAADVKLMGAIGAFLGWKGVFNAFLFSAVIGGVYSVATMAEAGVLRKILKNILEMVKGFFFAKSISYEPVNRNLKICYGLPIALGTIFSMWLGDRFF